MTEETGATRRRRTRAGATLDVPEQVSEPEVDIREPGIGADEVTGPVMTERWDPEVMRGMLAVPKSKNSVPTLACIDKGFYKRYFIIDVDGDAFKRAWDYYRATHEGPTADEFVTLVLRILEQGMPRMYRAVSYVPLV